MKLHEKHEQSDKNIQETGTIFCKTIAHQSQTMCDILKLYSKTTTQKIDKTKVLKTNGSLMKIEAFCNIFDLH